MNLILFFGVVIELCLLPSIDAKRTIGLTRSRSKNKGPSVRRNQQGHEFDDGPLPPVNPRPSMPEIRKPANTAPLSPPPSYHQSVHQPPSYYGAPPAYSASMQPVNSRFGQNPGTFGQPGYHQNQFSPYSNGGAMPLGGSMPMGGVMPMSAQMPMGVMPMGSPSNYGRSNGMGSGIMTNLFAGFAGYQLAKAFSGSHGHRDHEILVIDNRQPINVDPSHSSSFPVVPPSDAEILPNLTPPEEEHPRTQPSTQMRPPINEYNYYGVPQYGIPLYGYNLPSQITDYYQTAIIPKHREFNPPTYSYYGK